MALGSVFGRRLRLGTAFAGGVGGALSPSPAVKAAAALAAAAGRACRHGASGYRRVVTTAAAEAEASASEASMKASSTAAEARSLRTRGPTSALHCGRAQIANARPSARSEKQAMQRVITTSICKAKDLSRMHLSQNGYGIHRHRKTSKQDPKQDPNQTRANPNRTEGHAAQLRHEPHGPDTATTLPHQGNQPTPTCDDDPKVRPTPNRNQLLFMFSPWHHHIVLVQH